MQFSLRFVTGVWWIFREDVFRLAPEKNCYKCVERNFRAPLSLALSGRVG
jgi:hypothetical protein